MAPNGLRISWAIPAVRRPEGGELQLLSLLGDLREVFEKYQGLVVRAMVQGNEARLQF